jgi:hypothetical protein
MNADFLTTKCAKNTKKDTKGLEEETAFSSTDFTDCTDLIEVKKQRGRKFCRGLTRLPLPAGRQAPVC